MKNLWGRLMEKAAGVARKGARVAAGAVGRDADVYKHLLWQMCTEAGSRDEAWAGQARDPDLAAKYSALDDLLEAYPRLARYRNPDNGESALFWACFYGPLSLVQRLESMGADVKATTSGSVLIWYRPGGMQFIPAGCTTLMMAAAGGQTEICRYLLEKGVPVGAVARDPDDAGSGGGHTALFMAARGRGTGETARVLLEAGADPDLGEAMGFTPAGEAAGRGAGDVLEALVEAGADLEAPSGSRTVMELASEADDPSAMRALVKASFGRVLRLEDVTAALDAAAIEYQVADRADLPDGVDRLRYLPLYAELPADDVEIHVFIGRSDAALAAFNLEAWLGERGGGARRFCSEGEIKSLLGIAEGGITPFAGTNASRGSVAFREYLSDMTEGRVAVEAFDGARVVVLAARDLDAAVRAFVEHMRRP